MVELPTGTVTLLFTDIEGSTARLRERAGTWASTLQLHREVCRTAWSEHGGHELGTEGEAPQV